MKKKKEQQPFVIEKDVPLPERALNGGSGRRYPWREMEIGDSVLIPCGKGEDPGKVVARLGNSLAYAAPKKFTRKRENDGVRVWRIA